MQVERRWLVQVIFIKRSAYDLVLRIVPVLALEEEHLVRCYEAFTELGAADRAIMDRSARPGMGVLKKTIGFRAVPHFLERGGGRHHIVFDIDEALPFSPAFLPVKSVPPLVVAQRDKGCARAGEVCLTPQIGEWDKDPQ